MQTGSGTAEGQVHADGLVKGYVGGKDFPLTSYAGVIAVYATAVTGLGALLRRRQQPLPRITLADVALMGVATHKLSRRLTKDPVTGPLRAPFARLKGTSGPAELNEQVRGRGVRRALGELVTCPFCLSQWVATGFAFGLVLAPQATRLRVRRPHHLGLPAAWLRHLRATGPVGAAADAGHCRPPAPGNGPVARPAEEATTVIFHGWSTRRSAG